MSTSEYSEHWLISNETAPARRPLPGRPAAGYWQMEAPTSRHLSPYWYRQANCSTQTRWVSPKAYSSLKLWLSLKDAVYCFPSPARRRLRVVPLPFHLQPRASSPLVELRSSPSVARACVLPLTRLVLVQLDGVALARHVAPALVQKKPMVPTD